ncbi:hypothetical protein like AT3G25270 [Hibiscus trionum]|uniref:RNase H type-1 domain-containing protein n=1 Tax=Hibiscus trionum TaxID=183268 RepID=A0A9W7HFL1_HIBTR|nr:hypothetical protein like AT3G25270 [Hibiscus trionum]
METPPAGWLKLNVDGATRQSDGMCGVGGLLRDHNGNPVGTFSERRSPAPPLIVEVWAIERGLRLCLSDGWFRKARVMVESDCKKAVDLILKEAIIPVHLSGLVRGIREIVSRYGCMLKWIPRSCNTSADSLAKRGIG